MGIIQLDAYVLLVSGSDRFSYLDGLSTNKVDQSCSTVLTSTNTKILDVIHVIEVGENLAIVGYPYKATVLKHLQPPNITTRCFNTCIISMLNDVYLQNQLTPFKMSRLVNPILVG